jgi:hypothetical protein
MRTEGSREGVDMLTDLNRVREHAFDTIKSDDQVARSGWVGFHQQMCPDMLVGGDRIALEDEASDWSGGFRRLRTGADVRHALRKDDAVGRSHRVA